jgi:K+-dependent Na+/Ca+ exchanger related-protein
LDFLAIISGNLLLSIGGDMLTRYSVELSHKLSIPKIIIGMTIVSFATSAPELIVSLNATMMGYSDFALGNVLGSNIANLGLVLGIVVIIYPITIKRRFYYTDFPLLIMSTAVFYLFIASNSEISRTEGIIMLVLILLILFYLFYYQKPDTSSLDNDLSLERQKVSTSFFLLVISAAILWLGAETLIKSSISVANKFNVSERIISITMVAIGTSIPELAASVAASLKKHNDLAIGNLIGSNIFNLLVVIGITSIVNPITGIDFDIISKDMIWVVVFSFILLPLVYFHKRNKLNRMKGIILLAMYVAFIIPLVLSKYY